MVDMRDIPAGLVYSRVELFTTTVATLSNTVLAEGGGSLRDGHAKDTWQLLVNRATAARPRPLQQQEMAAPTACTTLAEKVSKMQEALRLKEDGARRQADADGVLVAPLQDVCTASRLASAAQVLEEDAPARAASNTCVRAGVSGRGAARRGAPGAAGVPPGAPPPAKRARRMGDGAVLEAVDSPGGAWPRV